MRWLQWSTADLQGGLGGVEVAARSLARELRKRGIQCSFSSDPGELSGKWDVILTHGSSPGAPGNPQAVRLHVLHGTTLGRMASCGEWTWPGGYLAAARELRGVLQADIVLSVNPELSLFHFAKKIGKKAVYCSNGWDASEDLLAKDTVLPETVRSVSLRDSWLFVGRGDDRMKGVDRIVPVLGKIPGFQLIAAPGTGFDDHPEVHKMGRLDSIQVGALMFEAKGLLIPSRYEGHSLVILEALARGLPVIATPVGGVPYYPQDVQGLFVLRSTSEAAIRQAVEEVGLKFPTDLQSREARARVNQQILPRWGGVTALFVKAVEEFLSER